jgi:hypothetical protein
MNFCLETTYIKNRALNFNVFLNSLSNQRKMEVKNKMVARPMKKSSLAAALIIASMNQLSLLRTKGNQHIIIEARDWAEHPSQEVKPRKLARWRQN